MVYSKFNITISDLKQISKSYNQLPTHLTETSGSTRLEANSLLSQHQTLLS